MASRWAQFSILLLTFLIGVLTNVATSTLPASWEPYLWLAWVPLVVCFIVVAVLELRSRRDEAGQTPRFGDYVVGDNVEGDKVLGNKIVINPLLTAQQRLNRSRMLDKVELFWVKGVLEQSLYQIARVELGLEYAPEKVEHPWKAIVQEVGKVERVLQPGQRTIEVFDSLGGELLILGAPGAGKTTLLLELARDLIVRARGDEQHPIPVVFNLSTWAVKRAVLGEWLVEELNQRYDVPKKVAQEWVVANAILPLLDGLDEVAAQYRADCVKAINAYRQNESLMPLAVCSRVADYEALSANLPAGATSRLKLAGAVVIQQLERGQIEDYLAKAGPQLEDVRVTLHKDPTLWELLDTPLMLSIVALTYKYKSPTKLRAAETPEEQRRQLFDDYIVAMFQRRTKDTRYSREQTVKRLSWLAERIQRNSQVDIFIEYLNDIWFPESEKIRLWIITVNIFLYAIVIGPAFAVVPYIPIDNLPWIFSFGVSPETRSILMGISGILVVIMLGYQRFAREKIIPFEIDWSVKLLISGILQFGLGLSIAGAIDSYNQNNGFVFIEIITPILAGIIVGLLFTMLIATFLAEKRPIDIYQSIRPNEAIHRSLKSSLIGVLPTGLLFCLFGAIGSVLLGAFAFPVFVLVGALLGFLESGGRAVLQHYTIRLLLWLNGSLPWNLARFLDYCAERIFLRKVGGGYIFVHRLLMEHIASLDTSSKTPTT